MDWNKGTQYAPVEKGEEELSATCLLSKPSQQRSNTTVYYRKLAMHLLSCLLIVGNLAAMINYLAFKAILYKKEFHQVLAAPWLLLLFACECMYFIANLMSAIDNVLPPSHRPDLGLLDIGEHNNCPTVHIFLPCCKEPTEVPIDTIRAALAMDYPQDRFKVMVLDDGADDDLRAFCEALQVDTAGQVAYLRRPKVKGKPHHFKCGNMNYGLQHTTSEYVVLMDADMILHPTFLRRLLPHIINSPNVAFVQVPQSFYNLPLGDPLNDACMLGYERVLVHRDSMGFATCIGTGAIFRRQHLDDIGGFQPQSITEDTITAYMLFNQGYKSVYLNEKLQIGITPWTFEGYIKQRVRWGQGAMQQFAATWKSMLRWSSKLNLVQKAVYFWHTGYYFISIVNVMLVLILVGILAFGLDLTVGDVDDNIRLFAYLALYLVMLQLAWLSLWWDIPQSIQSRNHEESHFWWITPFFFGMCMKTIFSFSTTFEFVPTSNIDSGAAAGDVESSQPGFLKQRIARLKQVRVHLAYTFVALVVMGYRAYHVARFGDCNETFFVVGLSVFHIRTCAHMLLPVMYLVWPPNFKPSQRKSLLRYDANGVAKFSQEDCVPKWSSSVIIYETLSVSWLAFWTVVLCYSVRLRSGAEIILLCKPKG